MDFKEFAVFCKLTNARHFKSAKIDLNLTSKIDPYCLKMVFFMNYELYDNYVDLG